MDMSRAVLLLPSTHYCHQASHRHNARPKQMRHFLQVLGKSESHSHLYHHRHYLIPYSSTSLLYLSPTIYTLHSLPPHTSSHFTKSRYRRKIASHLHSQPPPFFLSHPTLGFHRLHKRAYAILEQSPRRHASPPTNLSAS